MLRVRHQTPSSGASVDGFLTPAITPTFSPDFAEYERNLIARDRKMTVLRSMDCLRRALRRYRGAEDGNVTIEYVLWLPIWVIIMTMTADATTLFHQRSQFFLAARDMSRQVSVGAKTLAEAELSVEAAFSRIAGFDATVTESNGFVTTSLSAPFGSFTNLSGKIVNGNLRASVTMYIEAVEETPAGV